MRYGQSVLVSLLIFAVAQCVGSQRRARRVGLGLLLTLFGVTAVFYARSGSGSSAVLAALRPAARDRPADPRRRRRRDRGEPLAPARHRRRRSRVAAGRSRSSSFRPLEHGGARRRRAGRDRGTRPPGDHARLRARPDLLADRSRVARAHHRFRLLRHSVHALPECRRRRPRSGDHRPRDPEDASADGSRAIARRSRRSFRAAEGRRLLDLPRLSTSERRGGGWLSPSRWKLDAIAERGDLATLFDRDVLSGWSTKRPREAGDWLSVDLGETHSIDEVHLLSAIRIRDIPNVAVLETSLDGETWTERSRLDGLNWYWWNGHPKLDDEGRVSFYFEPVPARHLRVRLLDGSPSYDWSVTEIFVRAADVAEGSRGAADLLAGLLSERRGFVGISYHSGYARYAPAVDSTPWDEVARDYARAASESRDDPEPFYRLGRVLWIKKFFGGGPHRRTCSASKRSVCPISRSPNPGAAPRSDRGLVLRRPRARARRRRNRANAAAGDPPRLRPACRARGRSRPGRARRPRAASGASRGRRLFHARALLELPPSPRPRARRVRACARPRRVRASPPTTRPRTERSRPRGGSPERRFATPSR